MAKKRAEIDARGKKKVIITIDDPSVADSAVKAEVDHEDIEVYMSSESVTITGDDGKRLTITIAE